MNEIHALPRLLTPRVESALAAFPVVVLTGARQTGRSTLVRRLADGIFAAPWWRVL